MTAPLTADQLEALIHAALKAGDITTVGAALHALAAVDPSRAAAMYDTLQLGLAITEGAGR